MSRQSPDRSTRSQQQQSHIPKQQRQPTSSSAHAPRSRRNIEQQEKLDRRAAVKARFGSDASQLKLTIFIILTVALVLSGIAFFSTNWLEAERRYYGSKFKQLGLWRMCFNSFSAPDDFQFKKFYVGCRWIFADEYKPIRKFLLPGLLTFLIEILFMTMTQGYPTNHRNFFSQLNLKLQ